MTRDEIIKLAREAGSQHQGELFVPDAFALRFAALVAQHEREECAKVCEKRAVTGECYVEGSAESDGCAAAIRARGEKP